VGPNSARLISSVRVRAERNEAIRLLKRRQPDLKQQDIAESLRVSPSTVSMVIRIDSTRRDVASILPTDEHGASPADTLSDQHIAETLPLERDRHRQAGLIQAAAKHGWTRDQMRDAVGCIRSPKVSAADQQDILAGVIRPVRLAKDGSGFRRVPTGGDARLTSAWDSAMAALERLNAAGVEGITEMLRATGQQFDRGTLPEYARLLEALVDYPDRTGPADVGSEDPAVEARPRASPARSPSRIRTEGKVSAES
jgi:predicted transcriptional regulator